MTPEFEQLLAKAAGSAIGIYAAIWFAGHLLFRRMARPPRFSLHFFALSLGAWVAASMFFAGETWVGHIGAALIIGSVLFLWVLFDRLVCGAWLPRHWEIQLPIILRQFGGVLVVLVTLCGILKWGYSLELTGLLATSGIAAVILGFAMQDLLSNVIAGFSIHMTRAYQVGDWLLLGEKGERAEVTEINWRSTRLVNNDQVSFEMPNSDIVKNRIVNLNYPTPEHRIRLQIGLDYDVPPALAKQALLAATENVKGVINPPAPTVYLSEFGDHCVIYELRVWMRHASLYNVACDGIRTALWYELKRRGINIPYPTRSLEIRKPNEPVHFADARERAAEIVSANALRCLTGDEAHKLAASGRIALFGPGEALVSAGESGDSMFVILEGRVQVIGKSDSGRQVHLAKLGAGECFGEISLLTGEPRSATVTAETDTLALEIRKRDISPLIQENPGLAGSLGELLERRMDETAEALQSNARVSGQEPQTTSRKSWAGRILAFFGEPAE